MLETDTEDAPAAEHTFAPERQAAALRAGHCESATFVERLLNRDAHASQAQVEEYGRGMRFVLHRQGVGYWDAAELAQEAWAIAITRIRRRELRDPATLGAFLCGIARSLALNLRRKTDRQRTTADSDLLELFEAEADAPEHCLSRAQNAELVWQVLASLRRRDREVLEHFFLRGEDKDEVCLRLGISPSRFHGILSRAKQRFQRQLQKTAAARELEYDHD
jgi:RNA polymerase sigma factor (sigma-70 family)